MWGKEKKPVFARTIEPLMCRSKHCCEVREGMVKDWMKKDGLRQEEAQKRADDYFKSQWKEDRGLGNLVCEECGEVGSYLLYHESNKGDREVGMTGGYKGNEIPNFELFQNDPIADTGIKKTLQILRLSEEFAKKCHEVMYFVLTSRYPTLLRKGGGIQFGTQGFVKLTETTPTIRNSKGKFVNIPEDDVGATRLLYPPYMDVWWLATLVEIGVDYLVLLQRLQPDHQISFNQIYERWNEMNTILTNHGYKHRNKSFAGDTVGLLKIEHSIMERCVAWENKKSISSYGAEFQACRAVLLGLDLAKSFEKNVWRNAQRRIQQFKQEVNHMQNVPAICDVPSVSTGSLDILDRESLVVGRIQIPTDFRVNVTVQEWIGALRTSILSALEKSYLNTRELHERKSFVDNSLRKFTTNFSDISMEIQNRQLADKVRHVENLEDEYEIFLLKR